MKKESKGSMLEKEWSTGMEMTHEGLRPPRSRESALQLIDARLQELKNTKAEIEASMENSFKHNSPNYHQRLVKDLRYIEELILINSNFRNQI